MANKNSYKLFNESNNHNKMNGYNNPYDDNYYDYKPLIDDDDDDEFYDDDDENEYSDSDYDYDDEEYGDENENYDDESDSEANSSGKNNKDEAQKKNKKDQDGENNEESDEELGDEDSQDDFGFKNPIDEIKNKYDNAKQKFEDTKEKARQTAENIKNASENIKNKVGEAKDKANEVKNKIKNAPQNLKNNIKNAPGNIKKGIKNIPQNIKKRAEEAKNNIKKRAEEEKNKKLDEIEKRVKNMKANFAKKLKKIKLYAKVLGIILSVILGILAVLGPVLFLASLYEGLFGLTSSNDNNNNKYVAASSQYTQEDIEKSLLYIGDSRMVGMQTTLNNSNIKFIAAESSGYNYLVEKQSEIASTITDNKIKFVVFASGINDLDNIDSYINFYNSYLADEKSKVNYLFLSVNPVNNTKAKANGYTVTNEDIKKFNDTLSTAVGDQYIDSYSKIKGLINSTDGVHYEDSTNKKVHEIVIKYIQNNIKKLNNYALLDSYPHGIGNTKKVDVPITTLLGESGVKELEESILAAVEDTGVCTKQAAAAAGVTLAYNLYQIGYRLPYFWGGEHIEEHNPVNRNWGTSRYLSEAGKNLPYGFDCSGFTSWAYSLAMKNNYTGITNNFMNLGYEIPFSEASTGDILVNTTHIIMVIENKGSYLVTLESEGGDNGLIFSTKTQSSINAGVNGERYQIRNIQPYLDAHCGA